MNFKKLLMIAVAAISLVSCKDDESDIILFSKPNLIYSVEGGEETIEIYCDNDWSVTVPQKSWITSVTPMSGKGNAKLTITVSGNESGQRRDTSIFINNQSLLLTQEFMAVEASELYGIWETVAKDYKFTFNEDLSCKSEMAKGTYEGTYTLKGNVITISIKDSPMKIVIVIEQEIKNNTLIASFAGHKLTLQKVISE